TGKDAWAFAKTDKEFQALLEHDNPLVQALVSARLGVKSTLEETRTERLLSIHHVVDSMPVPLRYSGAHTHRFSGDWNIHLQNLPRGGELRKAFKAPDGHVVVAVDASQIEARINAVFSGEHKLVEAFRRGEDVYASFAEVIYGYPVNKEQHKIERFVGKTGILSLGYGSSWPVFQNMCRVQGDVKLLDHEAIEIVRLYRETYPAIVANCKLANKTIMQLIRDSRPKNDDIILKQMRERGNKGFSWGPVRVMAKALLLPNETRLRYNDLHEGTYPDGRSGYMFTRGGNPQKIYG